MSRPSRPSAAQQPQAGGAAPVAGRVAEAIARNPRVRAALAGLDPDQRDHVRRAIAAAIHAKLGPGGGLR